YSRRPSTPTTWVSGWGSWDSTIRSFCCLQWPFSTISWRIRRVVHPTILASKDQPPMDRGMNHETLYGKGLRALSIATLASLAVVFALGTLITGSIWAKASWGHWWEWNEPVLVSFLIVFLLYCCYQPLRFSIEDPERQARYASVFAIVAGAFIPINFIAVRLARSFLHPRVLTETGGNLPGEMRLTFFVSLGAMTLLFITLLKLDLAAKNV